MVTCVLACACVIVPQENGIEAVFTSHPCPAWTLPWDSLPGAINPTEGNDKSLPRGFPFSFLHFSFALLPLQSFSCLFSFFLSPYLPFLSHIFILSLLPFLSPHYLVTVKTNIIDTVYGAGAGSVHKYLHNTFHTALASCTVLFILCWMHVPHEATLMNFKVFISMCYPPYVVG